MKWKITVIVQVGKVAILLRRDFFLVIKNLNVSVQNFIFDTFVFVFAAFLAKVTSSTTVEFGRLTVRHNPQIHYFVQNLFCLFSSVTQETRGELPFWIFLV